MVLIPFFLKNVKQFNVYNHLFQTEIIERERIDEVSRANKNSIA
jgi:hypothetical protein